MVHIEHLQNLLDDAANDTDGRRIAMSLVEAINTAQNEYHQSVNRQQKLLDKKDKGTFDVEVDGKSYPVKGKKVVKRRGDKTITKFKARGGKDTPVKKIKDKVVKKGNIVIKNKKTTKYRS